MNIHEHQAKKILKEFGAPVSNGVVILSIEDIKNKIKNLNSKKFVLKAQIHAGGRGKAGGVKLIKNKTELEVAIEPEKELVVLVEEKIEEAVKTEPEVAIELKKEVVPLVEERIEEPVKVEPVEMEKTENVTKKVCSTTVSELDQERANNSAKIDELAQQKQTLLVVATELETERDQHQITKAKLEKTQELLSTNQNSNRTEILALEKQKRKSPTE